MLADTTVRSAVMAWTLASAWRKAGPGISVVTFSTAPLFDDATIISKPVSAGERGVIVCRNFPGCQVYPGWGTRRG
jgi:hypothetical protein